MAEREEERTQKGEVLGSLPCFRSKKRHFLERRFAQKEKMITFALGFRDGELAQLVRAHDS